MTHIVIRRGRSPFQFALVAVCAVAGLAGLVLPGPGPSGNITRVFGASAPWFYIALLVSSLVVLAGMLHPRGTSTRFCTALQVERLGLWPLSAAALAYAAVNLATSGQTALVSALLTGGIGAAALVRARIIHVDLRRVDKLIEHDVTRGRGT